MMSSWTQATAGMLVNPWKVQQMESCIAANFPVQDSFQRMDKLLSPVLLKVLRPEGNEIDITAIVH